jgi:hypothetical protein
MIEDCSVLRSETLEAIARESGANEEEVCTIKETFQALNDV